MIHPNTEIKFINDIVGYGVFATVLIPKGTITYAKDPLEPEVTPEEYSNFPEAMQEIVEKYSYIDQNGNRVLSWDNAKFVNHCCDCNTMSTGYGFEFAIRDIQPGEQITDEYGLFNLEYEIPLTCGKNCCRKLLRTTDFDNYADEWDGKVRNALPALFQVPQPLWGLIDHATRAALHLFQNDPTTYRSVLALKSERAKDRMM